MARNHQIIIGLMFVALSIIVLVNILGQRKTVVISQKNLAIIKQDIINYLINDTNEHPVAAERLYNSLAKHQDVLQEYHTWVKTKRYPKENEGAIVVRGYTARKLAKILRGRKRPIGVYNELIGLRDAPEETLEYIQNDIKIP